ncbi:hypothetical protein [Halalkalibacter akibai]|uniref:Uncharacterized protein n=1 Tax=Halalkalibacter akibai (strain ATCC 43226 / DSM 21942 / CIP 109018 / JCM 9157 / 1139) TaxID=1236973 RepID=W4QUA2_HALA3|nr:hypothetical protein [Halalkalibacter akibai]GAE35750.1 hypothetical protein JCM9157_2879 [Halalkalibacter akibai JCM 9157]
MIEYDLALDEPSKTDYQINLHNLLFVYDQKAKDEIGSFIKIDYVPSQGIKLINANQTLAYGLHIKEV